MPAIRFFALLTSGRNFRAKQDAWATVRAIDAASVSLGDSKYFDEMRKYYLTAAVGVDVMEQDARKRALDPTSEAARILVTDLFDQAQRLS